MSDSDKLCQLVDAFRALAADCNPSDVVREAKSTIAARIEHLTYQINEAQETTGQTKDEIPF